MSRSIKVRIGQTSARKVVSSQRAAVSQSTFLDKVESIQDVDITGRSGNTLLMFDSTDNKYKHVKINQDDTIWLKKFNYEIIKPNNSEKVFQPISMSKNDQKMNKKRVKIIHIKVKIG